MDDRELGSGVRGVIRVRAGSTAAVAAVLVALLHVLGSYLSMQVIKRQVETGTELDTLVIRQAGRFLWPLQVTGDRRMVAFVVALAVVALLATVVASGVWFALTQDEFYGRVSPPPGMWSSALAYGAWWGVIFGWLPALGAAVAYLISNRGRAMASFGPSTWQPDAALPQSTWPGQPPEPSGPALTDR